MAAHFEPGEAFFAVRDALASYTDDVQFIDKNSPLLLEMNGKKYALQVNVTHFAKRKNKDEWRIQTGNKQKNVCQALMAQGYNIVILGFYSPLQVFSIWETADFFAHKGSTFSMYTRLSKIKEAAHSDVSRYEFPSKVLGRKATCINFIPSLLGVMIENDAQVHQLQEKELAALPKMLAQHPPVIVDSEKQGEAPSEEVPIGKVKIKITQVAYARDPKFSKKILDAYNNACCVCGMQLGLLDAAHIMPHGKEEGQDTVPNGLALCTLHHRAYDRLLININPDYTIAINQERVNYLANIKQIAGLDSFLALKGKKITLPKDVKEHPKPEFLEKAWELRNAT